MKILGGKNILIVWLYNTTQHEHECIDETASIFIINNEYNNNNKDKMHNYYYH